MYMFYCYFSNKLVVYECIILYLLWFVLDFVKLYLFINCWNFVELPNYMCCGEIINNLFNESILIFIKAPTKL
jgi:hypothetical protein